MPSAKFTTEMPTTESLIGVAFVSPAILQENLSNSFGLPYTFAILFDHKVLFLTEIIINLI